MDADMWEPLVSVVIPCHNHGRFLGQAIESVMRQAPRNVEIVVVDDGSTDNTREVMTRYPAVRGIAQANAGLAAARNVGLRASRGHYVVFLDADDLLLPGAVESGVRLLEEHIAWAFVSGGYRYVDKNADPISGPVIARFTDDHYTALLRSNYIAMGATVLFRRSVLDRIGGFDPTLRACEDWDVHLKIARQFPVGQHRAIVALYRRHDSNMSRNPGLMLRTALQVLRRQRRYVRRDPHLRRAYKAGVRLACDFYQAGDFGWGALADLVAGNKRRDAAGRLWFLLVHAPGRLLRSLPNYLGRAVIGAVRHSSPV